VSLLVAVGARVVTTGDFNAYFIHLRCGPSARCTGKGASRRLRHTGKVPAIIYGGHKDAQALILDQQNLLTMIGDERFLFIDSAAEDQQRHAAGSDRQRRADASRKECGRSRGFAAQSLRTSRSA